MDGNGGGMDAGMNGVGMGSTGEDSSDSGEAVLQSMGYRDSKAGMDRTDGNSTGSWTSILQTIIILARVGFLGVCFVYFLLTAILAIFGVHL